MKEIEEKIQNGLENAEMMLSVILEEQEEDDFLVYDLINQIKFVYNQFVNLKQDQVEIQDVALVYQRFYEILESIETSLEIELDEIPMEEIKSWKGFGSSSNTNILELEYTERSLEESFIDLEDEIKHVLSIKDKKQKDAAKIDIREFLDEMAYELEHLDQSIDEGFVLYQELEKDTAENRSQLKNAYLERLSNLEKQLD